MPKKGKPVFDGHHRDWDVLALVLGLAIGVPFLFLLLS